MKYMVLLFIIIFTIACSSTDPAIEKEKQKVSAKSVSAVEKTTEQVEKSSEQVQQASQQVQQTTEQVQQATEQVQQATEQVQQAPQQVQKTQDLSQGAMPKNPEPFQDIDVDTSALKEEDWEKLYNLYIAQHLEENLTTVPWAMRNSIPQNTSIFLEKGFGIYWNFVKIRKPKELDLGFYYARTNQEELLLESFASIETSGKGKHYYKLAYILACYYKNTNQEEKAKQLLESEEVLENLNMFGVIF
ncbi:MAG: hypothetical protein KBC30_05415 [Planctomycetes bacterium]|nr:hypothetical protein [Planctomycetota bacterium]HPY74898.1 hypothetical protein [Planctomycetota bacterium]HQB00530.1 hypothetical protein [Planctomycetota bacterium]